MALLVLLGLWAYLKEKPPGQAGPSPDQDRAVPFERSSLKALEITNDKGTVRLEKNGDVWSITRPRHADADKDAVEGLLNSLQTSRIDRRLGKAADLATYGLDKPRATLTVESTGPDATRVFRLGQENPVGGTSYVLLPAGEVAVVSAPIGDLVGKDLFSLRDKTLLAFDPWKIKKLTLERPAGTVVLTKPADGWKIDAPVEAPADGPTVTDLLSAVERARAQEFASESPDAKELRRFGLAPPSARVRLLQDGWDVEKTIELGKTEDGKRYARVVGRDPVLRVSSDLNEKIDTRVFDLRRKEVLALNRYRIQKVTATRDGKPALVLERQKDQSWTASGLASGTLPNDVVDSFLGALSDCKADAFDDHPSPALRTSLDRHPALDLVLEEEPETGEGPGRTQHLLLGGPDRAGVVRAMDTAWRPIARLPVAAFTKLGGVLDTLIDRARATPSFVKAAT
ncbi:MAG TPA: DUF4340 domain-containing protein, partial [Candidatus Polarisedimenticolia bacterium]|nr:DUF4340 domain-containing protein [Candidatus Polarisedimenticolia bacterium]